MKSIFISTVLLLVSFFVSAGPNVIGNGGSGMGLLATSRTAYGVIVANKVHLLDLMESGVDTSPYFAGQMTKQMNSEMRTAIEAVFPATTFPNHWIQLKLSEIAEMDSTIPPQFLSAAKTLTFEFVTDDVCISKERPQTHLGDIEMVCAATLIGNKVYIHSGYWTQMTPENQTALLFHMVLDLFSVPATSKDTSHDVLLRRIVGMLFSAPENRSLNPKN